MWAGTLKRYSVFLATAQTSFAWRFHLKPGINLATPAYSYTNIQHVHCTNKEPQHETKKPRKPGVQHTPSDGLSSHNLAPFWRHRPHIQVHPWSQTRRLFQRR